MVEEGFDEQEIVEVKVVQPSLLIAGNEQCQGVKSALTYHQARDYVITLIITVYNFTPKLNMIPNLAWFLYMDAK